MVCAIVNRREFRKSSHRSHNLAILHFIPKQKTHIQTCLEEEKEEKDSEREAPSVTVRSFVITSKVSPSPPSVVWLVVVVLSVFLDWSTKRLVSIELCSITLNKRIDWYNELTIHLSSASLSIQSINHGPSFNPYRTSGGVLKVFLENVIRDSVTYTEHARRKTVTAMDVVYALKRQGKTLYGFGG